MTDATSEQTGSDTPSDANAEQRGKKKKKKNRKALTQYFCMDIDFDTISGIHHKTGEGIPLDQIQEIKEELEACLKKQEHFNKHPYDASNWCQIFRIQSVVERYLIEWENEYKLTDATHKVLKQIRAIFK